MVREMRLGVGVAGEVVAVEGMEDVMFDDNCCSFWTE